ncbi:MAG: hypothetical protein Q8Q63_13150 [Phaeovulum sp.]|jgi:hypothetical protein|uniref:hypothetical protein n=1 Tax=Phaeovulum sp. TaxID=2934796 RepID=UPI002731FF38|nr:hypothetical protein [Phaeovulum sp.]MDP2062871.1 hypothetical protein [Phaeovulum sp.]MDP3862520.1 hypothetical protein [Phaeovulum sp.]
MKPLKIVATLVLVLFPFAAIAEECNGDHVAENLICPGTLSQALPGGGCVISG